MDRALPLLSLVLLAVTTPLAGGGVGGSFATGTGPSGASQPAAATDARHAPPPLPGTEAGGARARPVQRLVSIESPTGVYVLGSPVTVRGRAPPDVESVALYVRWTGDWHLLTPEADGANATDANRTTLTVSPNGRWNRSGVVVSNASIATRPGAYELGVIATADAVDENGALRPVLPSATFAAGRSARADFFARPPLASESPVFGDVDDQVALEDEYVVVRGRAPGAQAVLVLVVDDRGQLVSDVVSVSDGRFETELAVAPPDGEALSEGFAVGQVISAGRDGRVGDGEIQDELAPDLRDLESYLQAQTDRSRREGPPFTQHQVLQRIDAETVGDAGSDDLRLVDTFAVARSLTTIDAATPLNASNETESGEVEAGRTLVIRGRTNRRPGDTTLFVSVVDEASRRAVAVADTAEWGSAGAWRVTVSTAGVPPGNYTVLVDDGVDRDATALRIVPANASSGD